MTPFSLAEMYICLVAKLFIILHLVTFDYLFEEIRSDRSLVMRTHIGTTL